jgi:hypothetical protein
MAVLDSAFAIYKTFVGMPERQENAAQGRIEGRIILLIQYPFVCRTAHRIGVKGIYPQSWVYIYALDPAPQPIPPGWTVSTSSMACSNAAAVLESSLRRGVAPTTRSSTRSECFRPGGARNTPCQARPSTRPCRVWSKRQGMQLPRIPIPSRVTASK